MIKRIVFLSTVAMLVLTASCKKTQEISGSDPSTGVMPIPQQTTHEAAPDTVLMSPPPMPETTQAPPANGKYPVMAFDKTEHDFGTINQGDKVTYSFAFTNTGASDLIISNAVGSCGCTVPEYPKAPLKPGESGKIKVSFNSAGKNGRQQKTVTIATNTATGKEIITIKANITPKAGSGISSN
jgi:hypothetical protein